MKKIFAVLIAATLLGCAASANAAVTLGTITNYSKLTVSLVLTTNKASVTSGSTTKISTGSLAINNATLLSWFANWSGNNLSDWNAAGAQLVFDWDNYQVDVADKTGTNILFFAGTGVTNSTTEGYFYLDMLYYSGPYTESDTSSSSSWTQQYTGNMELYYSDSANSGSTIDIFSDGPDTEKFTYTVKSNTWSDTEKFTANNCGITIPSAVDPYYAEVTGTISATGKGPGQNPAIY